MNTDLWSVIESNKLMAAMEPSCFLQVPACPSRPPVSSPLPFGNAGTDRQKSAHKKQIVDLWRKTLDQAQLNKNRVTRRKRKQVQPATTKDDAECLVSLLATQNLENAKKKSSVTSFPLDKPANAPVKVDTKKVTFAPTVRIRKIRPIQDYSSNEIGELWYSPEDLAVIRCENVYTVRVTMKKQPVDEDLYCFRGLEHKTRAGCIVRKENRANGVIKAVSYFRLQEKLGLQDTDYLAKMYAESVAASRESARMLGKWDEAVAQKIRLEG